MYRGSEAICKVKSCCCMQVMECMGVACFAIEGASNNLLGVDA